MYKDSSLAACVVVEGEVINFEPLKSLGNLRSAKTNWSAQLCRLLRHPPECFNVKHAQKPLEDMMLSIYSNGFAQQA